jgi:hypothetical protein
MPALCWIKEKLRTTLFISTDKDHNSTTNHILSAIMTKIDSTHPLLLCCHPWNTTSIGFVSVCDVTPNKPKNPA